MSHVLNTVKRRSVLQAVVLGVTGAGALATSACSGGLKQAAGSSADVIKIGYVSPRTGAYAAFAESDAYILQSVREAWKGGLTSGGKTYTVEILDRDTGSDPDKAATIADELISGENVDMVLVTSTPDTVNPVANKCEAAGVPCVSTLEPWQAFYFGRGATPEKPFTYTFHMFDGLEDVSAAEISVWDQVPTNKKVGVLWPNDVDGAAFRDEAAGYRADPGAAAYTFVDPGAYENGTKDFSSIISTFQQEGVEILAGVPTPPDFATFWTQAAQQGFRPKVATIAKAILFASGVSALPNDLGEGLSQAVFWDRTFPYTSSITGETAGEMCDAYEASDLAEGRPWSQGMGPNHALFEVAAAVLTQADPKDRAAVAAQFLKTKVDTLMGTYDWTSGGDRNPVKNVATNPMVGAQWTKGSDGAFTSRIVTNTDAPSVPTDGTVQALA